MQRYNIFRDQSIDLANSLVIKFDAIAQSMNRPLIEMGGTVPTDKRLWRYYLHLAGKLHPTDTPIVITSLDTRKPIELTTANLARHKKTSNVYRYNTDYIVQLIYDYPEYAIYIKGVFWPIPLDVSIPAEDCEVLYYDATLVEDQEQSLLGRLSEWLRREHVRYMADGLRIHNDAFDLAFYSMLFPMLPSVIMNLRLQKVHTTETHSYHVTEFLASHQELHEYVPYLTNEQKFIIYRNIRYWERNSGKTEIFTWLIDTLFTKRDMPAVAYKVSQLTHSPTNDTDTSVVPLPTGYTQSLNFSESDSGRDLELVATSEIIRKEYALATQNPSYETEYLRDLNSKLSYTQHPAAPSMLIECTAVDPAAVAKYNLEHVLFNEWLHCTARGTYAATHTVMNPTNGDSVQMSTKELMALFLYASFRGYSGVTLGTIPDFNAVGVLIKRWVSIGEMLKYLPQAYKDRYKSLTAFYANSQYQILGSITSSDEMYEVAEKIMSDMTDRWTYTHNRRKIPDRAAAEMLFDYFYRDYSCPLHLPYKSYAEFFEHFGYEHTIVSDETWQAVALEAFNEATNYTKNVSISQTEIQRAMISLMTKLSSYTIHVAATMASDKFDVTNPSVPILDDILMSGAGSHTVSENLTDVQLVESYSTMRCNKPLNNMMTISALYFPREYNFAMNILPAISVEVKQGLDITISEPLTDVQSVDAPNSRK